MLVFYNDRASFQTLVQMMRSERDRMDENSPLMYHIHLVELLAVCTEGKNVYTEIKCNSLLPLDDIVRVVTHEDCIPEVSPSDTYREYRLCCSNNINRITNAFTTSLIPAPCVKAIRLID